jgi:hypothetical protein
MKGKKIVNIQCHVGIHQFAGQQNLNLAKMKDASAEMNAVGVLVRATQGEHKKQILIPFANIQHMELIDEVEEPKAKKE